MGKGWVFAGLTIIPREIVAGLEPAVVQAHTEILISLCRHSFLSGILISSGNLWRKHRSFFCVIWRTRWQSIAGSKGDTGSRLSPLLFDLAHSLFPFWTSYLASCLIVFEKIWLLYVVCAISNMYMFGHVCVCMNVEAEVWCRVFSSTNFHIVLLWDIERRDFRFDKTDWRSSRHWSPCYTCLHSARVRGAHFHTWTFYVSVEGSFSILTLVTESTSMPEQSP